MSKNNNDALDELKRQITQLDELIAKGVLSGDAARQARDALEQQVLALVAPGARPAAAPVDAVVQAPAGARPSGKLVAAITAFVVVVAVGGYLWRGNAEGLGVAPGQPGSAQAGNGSHDTDTAKFEAMVKNLAERLEKKPEDAEGWAMLGRSYAAMGRGKEAIDAYKKVVALKPKDAQALADLADGLATANNRNLDGEPEKLITQALAIDPTNVKALALAGTVAFNKSDFKAAVGLWERAVAKAEAGSEFAKQLQQAANEARSRAGMPVTAVVETPAPAAAAAPAAAPAAAGKEAITGRVTLADSLKGKVGPDDTLFIFARPATGPKMPLAILRKRVGDLPVDFQLDDTQAMSPATRLSGAAKVVVGARISKAGQATSQPGDLQGFSAEVSVGTQGLKIEINDTVR